MPGDTDAAIQDSLLQLQKLVFRAGTEYLYSNANVFLQKKIIEKVTGLSYPAFADQLLLAPCHVSRTAARNSASTALVAEPFSNGFEPVPMNVPESAGNFLTAGDLYHWATCLSDGELLSGSSIEKLSIAFGSRESSLGLAQVAGGKLGMHQHQGSGFKNESLLSSSADDQAEIELLTNNLAYSLIAEAWSKKGDRSMAKLYYEKALEIEPQNKNAKGRLDGLNGK